MSAPTAEAGPRTDGRRAPRTARLGLVVVFCLLLLLVPTVVVLPGPLRSNGSPAIMLGFVMAGLVALGFVHGSPRDRRVVNVGVLALLLFLVGELATYAVAFTRPLDTAVEASTLRSLLGLVADAGVGVYVIQNVRTRRERAIVIATLALGLFLAAVVGLLQGLAGLDLRYALQPPGFVRNFEKAGFAQRDGFTRVSGFSDHPIEFAVLMSCAVPLTLHLARFGPSRLVRQLACVSLAVLALAVPASVSRSAVVTLVAALLVYGMGLRLRALGSAALVGAAGLVVYYWAAPGLLGALYDLFANASEDNSISGRTDDYAAVSARFAEHPWFGLGLGTNPPSDSAYLDNQWLQAAVQGGVVGIASQALLFLAGLAAVVLGLRRAQDARDRDEVLALGGAFAAIFASGFTFDLLAFQQTQFLLFVLLGLLWAQRRPVLLPDPAPPAQPSPAPRRAAA